MPITLRPNDVNYKDGNSYKTMNVIADQKTSEKIAAIEAAASAEVTKITEKGTETRNSIPDNYTALSDQVVGLKSDMSALTNDKKAATAGQVWTATDDGAGWAAPAGGGEKEWVLKGALTTDNKDTGVTLDLTGCTEMMVRVVMSVSSGTTVNTDWLALFSSVAYGLIVFEDTQWGYRTTYGRGSNYANYLNSAMSSFDATNGKHVADISHLSFANPNAVNTCNIEIYAR